MKELVVEAVKKALKEEKIKLKDSEILNLIEIPPSYEMGDFAFPCFYLANKLKMNPHEIALDIRQNMGKVGNEFQDINVQGPYINFFVNRKTFSESFIKDIKSKKNSYGGLNLKEKRTEMVEFSQANTHKAFHIGHVRTTSLGESISRILEFNGVKVVRANYQGDTGMHVAKWLWCYAKYRKKQKLKKDEAWIASIYVDAVKKLSRSKSKKLQGEVDEINRQLELKKDKLLNSTWKKTRQLSLDSLEKIYKELNTHFDRYYFESEMEPLAKKEVAELLKKKIAIKSDNAIIVNLKKYNLGVWVLLRSDGTVLYSGKDIVLAKKKFKDYKLDRSLYVVASEQDFHFRQLFKVLELMKFPEIEKCKHISYNLVRLPGKKMSSRTGDNILYSDFMKELTGLAKKGIKKRSKKISNKELERRSLIVAISALKYSILKQTPNRVITFDKKEALNFEGDTGPYLLYSYARANSILKKSKQKHSEISKSDLHEKEFNLIKKISYFQDVVYKAYKDLNPSLIANYSYQLSQIFNEFYHACPVIKDKNEPFRLSLVQSFKQVFGNSLNLLGIEPLEEM